MKEANQNSYLSFKLDDEIFAANVGNVIEILEQTSITKVPKTPDYMLGITNLRGNVLPVIDTKIKFGLKPIEMTKDTCVIVIAIKPKNEELRFGIMVDAVLEVKKIDENEMKAPPSIGKKYNNDFIRAMGEVDSKFMMILDLEKIFSLDEITELMAEDKIM